MADEAEIDIENDEEALFDEMVARDEGGEPVAKQEEPEEDTEGETEADAEEDKGEEEPEADAKDADDEPEEPDDIWAGASEQARAEFERLQQYRSSQEGRLAAERRQNAELRAQLEQRQKEPAPEPEAKDDFDLAELDYVKDEFPDIYAPLSKAISAMTAKISRLETELGETKTGQKKTAEEVERDRMVVVSQRETASLEEEIPGWFSTLQENADAYKGWLANLGEIYPEEIAGALKAAHEKNKTFITSKKSAAYLIGRFMEDSGLSAPKKAEPTPQPAAPSPKRQRQLESAATVPGRRAKAPAATPDDGDEEAWFEIYSRQEA